MDRWKKNFTEKELEMIEKEVEKQRYGVNFEKMSKEVEEFLDKMWDKHPEMAPAGQQVWEIVKKYFSVKGKEDS